MSAKEKKHNRYEVEGRRAKNKERNIARNSLRELRAREKNARRAKRPRNLSAHARAANFSENQFYTADSAGLKQLKEMVARKEKQE